MAPVLSRVLKGMGANTYGQAVTVAIQLSSLPIFLIYWDLHTYGIWLTISAIPGYLAMADIGMVAVAGNRMTALMGVGDVKKANQIFQSAQVFVLISCMIVAIVAIPMVLLIPSELLSVGGGRQALLLLVLCVLLSIVGGLSNAVFKATQRYAFGTSLETTTRLLEWGGAMVGLVLYGTFASVAAGMLVVRLICLLINAYICTSGRSDFSWGVRFASIDQIRLMIVPSFGFMLFPVGNAMSLQGFTLLTANLLGPAYVAIFNTYRTIARIVVQMTSILSHSMWPEFSRLYGVGGEELKKVFIASSISGGVGAIFVSGLTYFIGPILLEVWTHGEIEFFSELMFLMVIYAAIGGSLHVPKILLMATNNHMQFGVGYLIVAILSIGAGWGLGGAIGLSGVVWAMILSEGVVLVLCLSLVHFMFKKINVPVSSVSS